MNNKLKTFSYQELIGKSKRFKFLGGNIYKSYSNGKYLHFKLLQNNYYDVYKIYVDTDHVSDIYFEYEGKPFEKEVLKSIKSVRFK
jgi:hypothetical protein